MKNGWAILTLIFAGALFIGAITHAAGFSTAAGSVFTGVNGLAGTLEGTNIKSGT